MSLGFARDSIVGLSNLVHDDDDDAADNGNFNSNYSSSNYIDCADLPGGVVSESTTFLFLEDEEDNNNYGSGGEQVKCGAGLERHSSFKEALNDDHPRGTRAPGSPAAALASTANGSTKLGGGVTSADLPSYGGFSYEGYQDYYAQDYYSLYNDGSFDSEGTANNEQKKNIFCCFFAPWWKSSAANRNGRLMDAAAAINAVGDGTAGAVDSETANQQDKKSEEAKNETIDRMGQFQSQAQQENGEKLQREADSFLLASGADKGLQKPPPLPIDTSFTTPQPSNSTVGGSPVSAVVMPQPEDRPALDLPQFTLTPQQTQRSEQAKPNASESSQANETLAVTKANQIESKIATSLKPTNDRIQREATAKAAPVDDIPNIKSILKVKHALHITECHDPNKMHNHYHNIGPHHRKNSSSVTGSIKNGINTHGIDHGNENEGSGKSGSDHRRFLFPTYEPKSSSSSSSTPTNNQHNNNGPNTHLNHLANKSNQIRPFNPQHNNQLTHDSLGDPIKPPPSKSIHFNPMARVLTIPSRKDIPITQKTKVWWQKTDYDEFKKTGRIISKAMECGGSEIWLTSNNRWGRMEQRRISGQSTLGDNSAGGSGSGCGSAGGAASTSVKGTNNVEPTTSTDKGEDEKKQDDGTIIPYVANVADDDATTTNNIKGAASAAAATSSSTDDVDEIPEETQDFGNKWWCKFGHSRRGIEHIASPAEGKARQQSVLLASQKIMEEQKRQRAARKKDSVKLRNVAMTYTGWARDLALAAGMADAEAVKCDFDGRALVRKSRAHYFAVRMGLVNGAIHAGINGVGGSGTTASSRSGGDGVNGFSSGVAMAVTSQILDENTHSRNSSSSNSWHLKDLHSDDSISHRAMGFMGA